MIKKLVSFFCILLLLCSMSVFAGAETPVEISCADDFLKLRDNPDGHFVLTQDIRFIAVISTIPVFNGTLDGKGYTINGLAVESQNNKTALIGENNGTIRDLHIKNANMQAELTSDGITKAYTAALVGKNNGTVERCSVSGTIRSTVSGTYFSSYVGGLVACNTGTITDCYSNASVSGANDSESFVRAGGLLGENDHGTVSTSLALSICGASSSDTNNTGCDAGAVIGYNNFGHVQNVYSHTTFGDVIGNQQVNHTTDVYASLDSVQIITQSSFVGFDFTNVWEMGNASPLLRKAPFPCNHIPGDWRITQQPSYMKEGLKTQYCATCGEPIGTEKMDKLPGVNVLTVFKDIKAENWFVSNGAIDFAYNMKLFNGTNTNTFSPDMSMNRGMFVTVLGRLHGVDTTAISAKTKFTDVNSSEYYAKYVKWASDNGIVNGTGTTTFSPLANVSREQICAMMVRYCNFAGITLKNVNTPMTFRDASKISDYAKAAVAACQKGGIVNGKDGGMFDPQGKATRAEVATIMMNFYNNYVK